MQFPTLTYGTKLKAPFIGSFGRVPLERHEAGSDQGGAKIVGQYHHDDEEEKAKMEETGHRGHWPPHQVTVDSRYGDDSDGGEGQNRTPIAQLTPGCHFEALRDRQYMNVRFF